MDVVVDQDWLLGHWVRYIYIYIYKYILFYILIASKHLHRAIPQRAGWWGKWRDRASLPLWRSMLRWWRLEARCRSISSIGLHTSKNKQQLKLSQNIDVFSAMQSCSSGVHLPWIMAPHSQIMPTLLVALIMWKRLCSQRLLLFTGYNVQDAISSKHQKARSWLYKYQYRCQQVTVCRSNIGGVTRAHSPYSRIMPAWMYHHFLCH